MKSGKRNQNLLIICLVVLGLMIISASNFARAEDEAKPERAIVMAAEYPGVEIAKDEDLSMDIIFHNKGRKDEEKTSAWILFSITKGAKMKTSRSGLPKNPRAGMPK
jgi:hypothetical protein